MNAIIRELSSTNIVIIVLQEGMTSDSAVLNIAEIDQERYDFSKIRFAIERKAKVKRSPSLYLTLGVKLNLGIARFTESGMNSAQSD